MRDWVIADGKFGRRLTLESEWVDDFLEVFKRENVEELVMMNGSGSEWDSLEFLEKVPWLKSFTLLDIATRNIRPIHFLTELRSIYMADYSEEAINFTRFPHLLECRMEFCRKRVSVGSCANLELLMLQHFPYHDLTKLTSLNRLTTLDVTQGSLGDISKIVAFPELKNLSLGLLRNLADITPISELKRLEVLDLQGSKLFRSLDALSDLQVLRELNISNCGSIDSLKPLLGCRELQRLDFSYDTNILDGDLTVLTQMPNLTFVTLANRRHYNMKREEIPAFPCIGNED